MFGKADEKSRLPIEPSAGRLTFGAQLGGVRGVQRVETGAVARTRQPTA
jgi:hypothetical protein